MSADNWTTCPRCMTEEIKKSIAFTQKVNDSYGKIPLEEWEAMKNQDKGIRNSEESLREDYWIGLDGEGYFTVSYGAQCLKCHFEFQFSYSEQIKE